jgi:hypothetical protein
MITHEDQTRLIEVLRPHWEAEVISEDFERAVAGKEPGHRIADYAEERTVEFVAAEQLPVAYQYNPKKAQRDRSMGDFWLRSGNSTIYNPVNVKTGIEKRGGQPNMVSLEKLTQALLAHEIDSYWLLLVRITATSPRAVTLKIINLLDYLQFIHFDAGPGQTMLKNDVFYKYDGGPQPLSIDQAVHALAEIRRDGNRRLLANREIKLNALEQRLAQFDSSAAIRQESALLLPVNYSAKQ